MTGGAAQTLRTALEAPDGVLEREPFWRRCPRTHSPCRLGHLRPPDLALLGFDGRVKFEAIEGPGEPLPEDGLFIECAGGTEIAIALARGLEIIRTHPGTLRKADLVLITDGGTDEPQEPWSSSHGLVRSVPSRRVGITFK